MKKMMDEYRISMDKITPSASFISDTESMMKKIRDEQAAKKSIDIPPQSETMPLMDLFGKEARRRRIKKAAAAFSAAAAVLIAAVSLNLYNKVNIPNVDTSVTEKTVSESSGETGEEMLSAVTEPEITVTTVTSSAEDGTLLETQEIYGETSQDISEGDGSYDDSIDLAEEEVTAQAEPAQTEASGQKSPRNGHDGVHSANIMSDSGTGTAPVTYPENDSGSHSDSGNDDINPNEAGYSVSESYYDAPKAEETEYDGIPVYVPGFGGEGYEEDIYEEDNEESDGTPVSSYNYENVSTEVYSLRFSYDIGTENIEAADKVYVPDSIFSLDGGEYYLVITPGFDDYDPVNKTASAPQEVRVNENDTENIDFIMSSMMSAASGSDASYYDSEQRLSDYRYNIAVYSADESEDNAMLFDISFNSDCLVINRYDNGTVSSVEYAISRDEYDNSNDAVEQLYE